MIRSILKGQQGGLAILTALGFLLFSVPLITASLDLAQTSSIDARVKTDIVERHYCGLAVQEYLDYLLLDNSRWALWLTDHEDPIDPTKSTETVTDACGKSLTITAVQQPVLPDDSTDDPLGDPTSTIPPLSSYSNRDFQVTKAVSDPNPNSGDSVTYTITVINRDDTATTLTKIQETLPPGFSYECDDSNAQITLPGMAPQVIDDDDEQCSGSSIDWDMPSGTSIPPGGIVTVTFTVATSNDDGTYCNDVQVVPGGDKTRSGKTAIVQIGPISGPCVGESVVVSKSVDSAALVSTDTNTVPYTYTFDIDFTIKVDNIGSDALTISEFIDLLPVGFSYVSTSSSGDITNVPDQLQQISQVNRQEITWRFNPDVPVAAGTSKTLDYSTTATITKGNYWSDLLVDFGGGSFTEDRYTWPTALVSVKDVYDVTVTDDEGNTVLITLQVWIGDEDGVINTWDLN